MAPSTVTVVSFLLLTFLLGGAQSQISEKPVLTDVYPEFDLDWNNTDVQFNFNYIPFSVAGQIVPNITVKGILRAAARFWNSTTLKQAVGEMCKAFGPVLYRYLGESVKQVCQPVVGALDTSSPVEGLSDICYDFWALINQGPDYYDGSSYPYQPSYPSSYGGGYDHAWNDIRQLLERRLGLSIYNPYSICRSVGTVVNTNTQDILDFSKDLVRLFFSSLFDANRIPYKCSLYYVNDTITGIETDPAFEVFDTMERLYISVAGPFESIAQFCDLVSTRNDDKVLFEEHIKTAVERAYDIVNDVSLCNASVHSLLSGSSEDRLLFKQITGFETNMIYSLCGHLYSSFNSMDESPLFEIQLPDDFTMMNYELTGGEYLPGVSFADLVTFAGALLNTDRILDSVVLACGTLSPLFSDDVYPGLGMANAFCSDASEGNIAGLVRRCEDVLVPVMYGPDYPIALANIDFVREMLDIVLPLFNYKPWLEDDVICPAIETILNSDISVQVLAGDVMNEWIRIGIGYGAGICQSIEEVYNFTAPQRSWYINDTAYRAREAQHRSNFNNTFKFVSELAGFSSFDVMCEELIEGDQNRESQDNLVDVLRTRCLSFLTNEDDCTAALTATFKFVNGTMFNIGGDNPFYRLTGFYNPRAFCIESSAAFRGQTEKVSDECASIVDCAGVCNGDAVSDCLGVCLGGAVRDCARVCQGTAFINSCGQCVGGQTRRKIDFGMDQCGLCRADPDYRITWDCNGTCNGTAFLDKCKECVGGTTGKPADYNDHRINCRGMCTDAWRYDECNFCEPADRVVEGSSRYQDCNGDCFVPGSNFSVRAFVNRCDICVSGMTGLDQDNSINVCGQCESDPTADVASCLGCDNIPNSGAKLDACDVCNGTGTTCFSVQSVVPDVMTTDFNNQLNVFGAGFTVGSTLTCIFEIESSVAQTSSSTVYGNLEELSCNAPAAVGNYKLKIERDGVLSAMSVPFTVLPSIAILSGSPSELTINSTADSFTFVVTAGAGAFTQAKTLTEPSLIVEGDEKVYPGTFSTESDNIMYFTLPMPKGSVSLTGWPSINGVERLTTSQNSNLRFTAYYPAPIFDAAKFSPTGGAVVIKFSSAVAYNQFSSCGDVFQDITQLGTDASCRWRGARTLLVILGIGSDLTVGDTLTIKEKSVGAFMQSYSRYGTGSQTVDGPDNPIIPTVVLQGSSQITSCGMVKLNGRLSRGGAGRPMNFLWSVTSEADTAPLDVILESENTISLTLTGSLLQADTIYTFSLTAQNFLGESDTSSIDVTRSAAAVPEVTIFAEGADLDGVFVSDGFYLVAFVQFYADCVPPGATVYSWSVDDDNIALNLKTIRSRRLFVNKNSLPGSSNVVFTVTIYKSSEPENNVSRSVTAKTLNSDLESKIFGGNKLTVGRDRDVLVLDGSDSYDPDEVAIDFTYEWQCFQVTDQSACWSAKTGEEGTQFPSLAAASLSQLYVSPSSMEADRTYEFTLVVSKGARSADSSVLVTALNGNPPTVTITSSSSTLKSYEPLSLTAVIFHTVPLASYVWETVGAADGYGFLELTDGSGNLASNIGFYSLGASGSLSTLNILPGKLTAGSSYNFRLTVTTLDGQYGQAQVLISVLSEVTSCIFSLNGISVYSELEPVIYTVDNCVADPSAYPLTYRIFLMQKNRRRSITEKTSDSAITGVGLPVTEAGSVSNTFIAEVCDSLGSCATFAHTVDVTIELECTDEERLLLTEELVTVEKFKKNYAAALSNFNVIIGKCGVASRRRRAIASTTTDSATEQLALLDEIEATNELDTSEAERLIDECSSVNIDDLSLADQSRFIDILVKLVAVFEVFDEPVPDNSAVIVENKAYEIQQGLTQYDNNLLLTTIANLTERLRQSQQGSLQLGGAPLETVTNVKTRIVQRVIPTGRFVSKSEDGGIIIDLGSELGNMFSADWACSSGSCSGVTLNFEHWQTGEDQFSVSDEDRMNVAGDIVDLSIQDPSSGDEIIVANLSEPLIIHLIVTRPQLLKEYECRYWDAAAMVWSTSGIETIGIDSSSVQCHTNHLTAFTVFAVDVPFITTADTSTDTSTDASTTIIDPTEAPAQDSTVIIIVVVGSVLLLLAIIIILVVVIKHKKPKTEVSPSKENVRDEELERGAVPAQWASASKQPEPQARTRQGGSAENMRLVPVAINSLPPPITHGRMVEGADNVAPPPVYLPPTQY